MSDTPTESFRDPVIPAVASGCLFLVGLALFAEPGLAATFGSILSLYSSGVFAVLAIRSRGGR